MKPSEAKTRKKKRKSRKQRDKDLYEKKQADVDKRGDYTEKEKYVRGKSFSVSKCQLLMLCVLRFCVGVL